MAIIDWPDTAARRPAAVEWAQVVPEALSSSVFNQSTQSTVLGPAYWLATVTIGPRRREEVRGWEAFIATFADTRDRVRFWDWHYESPAGLGTGVPLVKGAGQSGRSLLTDGWTVSTAGLLLAGDLIGVNGELRRVIADGNSNGAGEITLSLDQALRSSPADNAPLTLTKPKALFICTTDKRSRGFMRDGAHRKGPTLEFMEVFA